MKIQILLLFILINLVSCQDEGVTKTETSVRAVKKLKEQVNKKVEIDLSMFPIDIADFENTVWICQVFPDIPECIDTLVLGVNKSGHHFSCEWQFSDSISFELKENRIIVNIWDFKSHVNTSEGKEIVSKLILFKRKDTLEMLDIKHLYGGKYESVESKFINQKYRKI